MKSLFTTFLFLMLPCYTFSQTNQTVCKCPVTQFAGTKADTVFHLSKNISIALCGYKERDIIKGKTLYREFVLSECGSKKIIKFWGAVELCDIKVNRDTLLVENMVNLPIGKSMNYKYTAVRIEPIYLFNGKLVRNSLINPRLPKYNTSQIAGVLNLYHHTPNKNDEKTAELMDKLLISAISGNYKAKYYLDNFPKKFTTLSGIYFEQYDDDIRMLRLWESKHAR